MADSLQLIADLISMWWDFLWETDIPGTDFSFGSLYAFVLVISLALFLMRIAINRKDGSEKQ